MQKMYKLKYLNKITNFQKYLVQLVTEVKLVFRKSNKNTCGKRP